jgi:hypothetical protein
LRQCDIQQLWLKLRKFVVETGSNDNRSISDLLDRLKSGNHLVLPIRTLQSLSTRQPYSNDEYLTGTSIFMIC